MSALQLPRGVRVGVDVGTVRVGLACSDPDGLLATPVATLARDAVTSPDEGLPKDVAEIAAFVRERSAQVVYVGRPRSLSGAAGAAERAAAAYAGIVARAVSPTEVRLVDERMTTVTAHQQLRASGRAGRKQRSVVDQAAAVIILQTALDTERSTGARAGEEMGGPPQ